MPPPSWESTGSLDPTCTAKNNSLVSFPKNVPELYIRDEISEITLQYVLTWLASHVSGRAADFSARDHSHFSGLSC